VNLEKVVLIRALRLGAPILDKARTPLSRVGNCTVAVISIPPGCGGGTLLQECGNLNDWCCVRLNSNPTNNLGVLAQSLHLGVIGHEAPAWGTDSLTKPVIAELRYRGHVPLLVRNADPIANAPKLVAFLVDSICNPAGSPLILQTAGGVGSLGSELDSPRSSLMAAVKSRITVHAKLPRPNLSDAMLLAEELLDQVRFEADLVEHIFTNCGKSVSVRALIFEFYQIEQIALAAGLPRIGLARWRALTDDEPAEPKKLTASQAAGITRLPAIRQAAGLR
jgi:hypothetical protein